VVRESADEMSSSGSPDRMRAATATGHYRIPNGPYVPSPIWPGPMRPGTMRPNRFFVPGRVGRRAELAAQARPYDLFLGRAGTMSRTGPRPARHYRPGRRRRDVSAVAVDRDESGSDRIIPLPHPHPYFLSDVERSGYYTDAVTNGDFFGCRIWCGVESVAEQMRFNIVG
jgi:hypothetical protein